MIYECSKCNKVFNQKSHYENHLRRKNPCKIIINDVLITNNIKKKFNTEIPQNCAISVDNTTKLTQNCGIILGTSHLDNSYLGQNNSKCKYYDTLLTKVRSFSLLLD